MATSFPALAIRAPESPIEQLGGALALKNAVQQNQVGALQVQQMEQNLADQHALTLAMSSWDGKNYADIPALVTKAGGSGAARLQASSSILAMQEKASEIAKSDAITLNTNAEAAAKLND